jgi:hypothetical protein
MLGSCDSCRARTSESSAPAFRSTPRRRATPSEISPPNGCAPSKRRGRHDPGGGRTRSPGGRLVRGLRGGLRRPGGEERRRVHGGARPRAGRRAADGRDGAGAREPDPALRKEAGLEITDRIDLGVEGPEAVATAVESYRDFITGETLALSLRQGDGGRGRLRRHPLRRDRRDPGPPGLRRAR